MRSQSWEIRLQRLVRAPRKRKNKTNLGIESRAGGGENSKLCQLGQKHHSFSAQCGLGFSDSRTTWLGVCPQCVNMASADVIIQQMPHLSKDLTPVCSLHPRGVASPPEGKQSKKRARIVGEGQVDPSLFAPAPVPVARGKPMEPESGRDHTSLPLGKSTDSARRQVGPWILA